jgi:hypothetical protein
MLRRWLCACAFAGSLAGAAFAQTTPAPLPAWAWPPDPPERRALVIGVGDYAYPDWKLETPPHDAEVVDRLFRDTLQFTSVSRTPGRGPTRDQIRAALIAFSEIIQPGDLAVIYYSGHGVQVKGRNYLIPADRGPVERGRELYEYVSVDAVIGMLNQRQPAAIVFILDACRTNPFAETAPASAATHRYEPRYPPDTTTATVTADMDAGLAQPAGDISIVVMAYSAAVGARAFSLEHGETPDQASIFTRRLVRFTPQETFFYDGFGLTAAELSRRTGKAQTPQIFHSTLGNFRIRADASYDVEQERAWRILTTTLTPQTEVTLLESYLDRHFLSNFANLARDRLADVRPARAALFGFGPEAVARVERTWAGALALAPFRVRSGVGPAVVSAPTLVRDAGGHRVAELDAGEEVRVLAYDARRNSALVGYGGGEGYILGVEEFNARQNAETRFAYQGEGAQAQADLSLLDGLGDRLRDARIRLMMGPATAPSVARGEELAYLRALELRASLIARGASPDAVVMEIAASGIGADEALVIVSNGEVR